MSASDWKRALSKMSKANKRSTKKVSRPVKTYVKRAISRSQETKRVRGYGSAAEITTTVTFTSLASIAQGDDTNERIGDRVKCHSFYMRGVVEPKPAAVAQYCRMVVFQWKPNRADDTPTSAAEILADPTNEPLFSPLLTQNPQFHLIKDMLLSVPHATETNRRGALYTIRVGAKKLRDYKFKDNTANEDSNHLYAMLIGEYVSGTGAASHSFHCELRYKDA